MKRTLLFVLALVLAAAGCGRSSFPTATQENTGSLGDVSLNPQAMPEGRFKSFMVPSEDSQPRDITLGADGAVWFTESRLDFAKIGRVGAKGRITEFPVPNASCQADQLVLGADGALWFTGPSGFPDFFIGRVTVDGQFTGFAPGDDPVFGTSIVPQGITSGPDGNIWFTENIRNAVVRLTPAGVFTFFTVPTAGANPSGITTGPDGALWFTEFNGGKIGRFDVATATFTEFGPVTGSPLRITSGPDGNLWFTEPFPPSAGLIGRITPAGAITEFPLSPGNAQPIDIVAGSDGNLWFTKNGTGHLAKITPDGVVTDVESVRGGPWGIGRGPGTEIWLTQVEGNRIARFTL